MSGLKGHAPWLTALLLAGCASTPEQAAESQAAAEPAESYAALAPEGNVVPDKIVDLNEVVDDSESTVICREHLKQGSNVIVQTCMTRANWEKFKRFQARDAAEIVRMLQGSAYR